MIKTNTTKIPVKYINGEIKIDSDKLLILSMLLQGRNDNDTTFINIKYLCDKLDTTTRNVNRTNFFITCLKYFEENNILYYFNNYDCNKRIDIQEFTNDSKTDTCFGQFNDNINDIECVVFNNSVLSNLLTYSKNNKMNRYLIFNLYLLVLYKMKNTNNVIIQLEDIKKIIDISKDTTLKYFEAMDHLNIIKHSCIGNEIRNGYKNISIVCVESDCEDFLRDNIENIAKELNKSIMLKSIKSNKNIEILTIHFDNLEELELKGLYLIRNLNNNNIKIGICNNLKLRFNEIRNSFRFCGIEPNLKIECFVETRHHYKLESYLHEEFKNYNIQNEWFNIENIDIVLDRVKEYFQ